MSHHSKKRSITILKKRSDFLRVAANNKSYVTKGIIFQSRTHSDLEKAVSKTNPLRLGFTVSKKVGKAVIRNKVKRRLRALAKAVLQEHDISNLDLVLIGRKHTIRRPFAKLQEDMENTIEKIISSRPYK